jgi:hypothetical protein
VTSASAAAASASLSCETDPGGRRSFFVGAWPEAERAQILQALRSGHVAVRVEGCNVRLLTACQTKARFDPQARLNCCATRGLCGGDELELCDGGRELYGFSLPDELAANLPREAAALASELRDGRTVRIRAESNQVLRAVGGVEIGSAGCEGATHYIKQARLGGFQLELAADDAWNSPLVRKISGFGEPGSCANGAPRDEANCGQPFFVELAPLNGSGTTDTRAVSRLSCVGSTMPHVVGGLAGLELLREHPDPALRLFALSGGEFQVCAAVCGGSAQRCEPQCSGGKRESCVSLALALLEAEAARKLELLRQACAASSSYGCFQLGSALDGTSPRVSLQPEPARAAYERACRSGIDQWAGLACLALAQRYREGSHGQPKEPARAAEYYAAACELGFGGCSALGLMLLRGEGAAKDVAAGIERLRQGCHLNDSHACLELGRAHVKGEGVPRDRALAVAYLRLGCNSIDRRSCSDLQRLGEAVPPRHVE